MTMFKNLSLALAAVAVALVANAGSAFAQHHASATANAEAKIVSGISLAKVLDLKFGSIVHSAEGGTVTIDATKGDITYEGVTQGQNSSYQTAQFTATGEASYRYTVSLPHQAKLEHEGGKGENMLVKEFTYSNGAGSLDDKGEQTFNVGGTLYVNSYQLTGKYIGTFDVAVQYE